MFYLQYLLAEVRRRPGRTALTVLGLAVGVGLVVMYAARPFRVSMLAAGIWVAVVILGAVLATDAAATRASRLTVREALAYL